MSARRSAARGFVIWLPLVVVSAQLIPFGTAAPPQTAGPQGGLTDEEIAARYAALTPNEDDFEFTPPDSWGRNLARGAAIASVEPTQSATGAALTVDGVPASTWTCETRRTPAVFTIDLGKSVAFDRLVVFNRQTDQRGTGGGNNALKTFEVLVSDEGSSSSSFTSLGDFSLDGPRAVCFKKKGGGQVCAFIDNTEPNQLALPGTEARFVRLVLKEAFWGAGALDAWKTTVALSEIMLYRTK